MNKLKINLLSDSSRKTKEFGKILGKILNGDEIVCLSGPLGSGKTTFIQGIIKGLGIKDKYISSPSFIILKSYTHSIFHIDLYRLSMKDIYEMGLEEFIFYNNKIVLIEWAEKLEDLLKNYNNKINVKLKFLSFKKRKIEIEFYLKKLFHKFVAFDTIKKIITIK